MKKLFTHFIVGIFVIAFYLPSSSQEIETLWDIEVTTASKTEEKLSDAPGIISVVSSEEIAAFGSTTLSDVLNRVTSTYMIHAGTYMWNIASMRGQNVSVFDNHVLILLNGRPLRDGISGGHNNVFYNSFPVEGIDHIEIIRGPGSVLYGSNAYSGVINIITKKATEKTGIEASATYGSFNTMAINVGGGVHVNDDLNINFGGRFYDDKGPDFGGVYDGSILKPDGTVGNGSKLGEENWTRDNSSAFLNVNYKGLAVMAGYGEMYPFGFTPPIKWEWKNQKAGDEISSMKHYFTDVGYTHEFNDNYSLSGNITYNGHKWQGMVDSVADSKKALSKNTLVEVAFQGSPMEDFNFIVGGLFDNNSFEGPLFSEDGTLSKYSAYVQADYRFSIVKLIAGAQLNKSENLDANISPRVGAVLNFNENIGAKVLYSTAFRSAYPQETNVAHSLYVGNTNLKPELVNTFEAQVFYQNEKIQTSLTFYQSHMTDLINKIVTPGDSVGINPAGDPVFSTFYNDGEFDFLGVEFEGKFSLSEHFSLFTNITYQQSEDGNGIKDAAVWPNTMAKGGIMYTGDFLTAGLYNSYFGEPTQVNYILEQKGKPTIESFNPEATAYNLMSLNVTLDIFSLMKKESKFKILFSIYADNLLDESIWFPEFARYELNSLPLHAGRSFYGKLAFQF